MKNEKWKILLTYVPNDAVSDTTDDELNYEAGKIKN